MDWIEKQPAGDSNESWQSSAVSASGKTIVALSGAGGTGKVWRSTDGGQNWTQILSSYSKQWMCCAVNSDGTRIIAGALFTLPNSGRLYLSTDGGESFGEVQPAGNLDKNWTGAAMSGDGQYIIVAAYGDYVYTSDDYGETWTKRYPNE